MTPEEIENKILSALFTMIGAPTSPESQYGFMTNPGQLQTMTRLKPGQVTFVTVAKMSAHDHPKEFEALDTWAKHLMLTMISTNDGQGRKDIIEYEKAKNKAQAGSSINIMSEIKDRVAKAAKTISGDTGE